MKKLKLKVKAIKLEDTPHHFKLVVSNKRTKEVFGSFEFQWEKTPNNDWDKELRLNDKRVRDMLNEFCEEHNLRAFVMDLDDHDDFFIELVDRRFDEIRKCSKLNIEPIAVYDDEPYHFLLSVSDVSTDDKRRCFDFVWQTTPNNDFVEEVSLNLERLREMIMGFCDDHMIFWKFLSKEREYKLIYNLGIMRYWDIESLNEDEAV